MLPLMFDPALPVLLVGRGPQTVKRLAILDGAGASRVVVRSDRPSALLELRAGKRLRLGSITPTKGEIAEARLLFVGDLPEAEAAPIAAAARRARVPVNVEDQMTLCDMHVPAMVRRGRLLLTVSTGGASPGAASRIRRSLEEQFGPGWDERLEEIAALRSRLRREGKGPAEILRATDALIDERSWLPTPAPEPAADGCTIYAF